MSFIKFKMPDNDVVAIKTGASPSIAGYYSGVGTINLGLAVSPITGDLFVANTDALNITCPAAAGKANPVCFEPSLRGRWVNNRITRIQVATGRITPFDLNPNIDYSILPNPQALSTALAQPAGVVFDRGSFMYVAAFGTDRVAQLDTNGIVQWFVELNPNVPSAERRTGLVCASSKLAKTGAGACARVVVRDDRTASSARKIRAPIAFRAKDIFLLHLINP